MRPSHIFTVLEREFAAAGAPDFLLPALQACVGPPAGIEFKAFVDHMEELPDLDAIVAGRAAHVPQAIDLQYGVAAALVRRAVLARGAPHAERVFGNSFRYFARST